MPLRFDLLVVVRRSLLVVRNDRPDALQRSGVARYGPKTLAIHRDIVVGGGLHQGVLQDYKLRGQKPVSVEIWLTQDTTVHLLTKDGRCAQGGSLTRQGEASRKDAT